MRSTSLPKLPRALVATPLMAALLLSVIPAARAQSAAQSRPVVTPGSTPRVSLTARLVTWPIFSGITAVDEGSTWLPPCPELVLTLKHHRSELSISAAVAPNKMLEAPGTYFALSVSAGIYSLRRSSIKLRHGLAFGLISDTIFERRPGALDLTPWPWARLHLLDILVRLAPGWWLEIMPATAGFPSMWELSLGLRRELGSAAAERRGGEAVGEDQPPQPAAPDSKIHLFFGLEMGLLWWHHYEPPVAGSTFGRLGLRWRWFEIALGAGSPAWATWRARGLYELFVDLGFYSVRRARFRIRHQARLGLLFHNPPFEVHTWSGLVAHADFCVLGFHLTRGLWAEIQPLTISIAPRESLSTSVGLRYEL